MTALVIAAIVLLGVDAVISLLAAIGGEHDERVFGILNLVPLVFAIVTLSIALGCS